MTTSSRPLPRAGDSTAKASARRWGCTPTHTTNLASSLMKCGAPCGSSSIPACITRAGPGSRRSITSRPMPQRPSSTSSTRSTATSPAGPGACLQDRRAQDQGASRPGDEGAGREIRHPRLPRCRARQRRGAARRARPQRRQLAEAGGCGRPDRRGSRPAVSSVRRRRSVTVRVGTVPVGGDHPVVVQSMTNTDTADVDATVSQVRALAQAGSELVRVTVNTDEAAAAVPRDRRAPRGARRHGADRRRLSFQRAQAAA